MSMIQEKSLYRENQGEENSILSKLYHLRNKLKQVNVSGSSVNLYCLNSPCLCGSNYVFMCICILLHYPQQNLKNLELKKGKRK